VYIESKQEKVTVVWRKLKMSFIICASRQLLVDDPVKENETDRMHVWERREILTYLWKKNLNGRNHLGYLGVDGRMLIKWILKE
jgi:hypothetical protein